MPYIASSSNFSEDITLNADANSTSTVTASLDVKDAFVAFIEVTAVTGTHASHVLTIQCSADDSIWSNMAQTISGAGTVALADLGPRFIRGKITTAEGGTSTVHIYLRAK